MKAIKRTLRAKPRYRFCWSCGNQFWGNCHVEMRRTRASTDIILVHAECADDLRAAGWYDEVMPPDAMLDEAMPA